MVLSRFGESYKRPLLGDFLSEGVGMYSSTDLMTWHNEGLVFNGTAQMTGLPCEAPFRIERPKVRLLRGTIIMCWLTARLCVSVPTSNRNTQPNSSCRGSRCADLTQIVYNKEYGRYVLLFHADTPTFSYPSVGVAYATEITGMRALPSDVQLGSTVHPLRN